MRKLILTTVLALIVLPIPQSQGFDSNHRRFLSGHDLIRTLRTLFPRRTPIQACEVILAENAWILGLSHPQSGAPVSKKPSQLYLQWWNGCVKEYSRTHFQNTARNDENLSSRVLSVWSDLEPKTRMTFLEEWIGIYGGEALYPDSKNTALLWDRELKTKKISVESMHTLIVLRILTSDAFLSY